MRSPRWIMNVVWHCADAVGASMAGPGIRALELARRLAARHRVTLVAPGAASLRGEPLEVAELSGLEGALRGADALVTQGFDLPLHRAWGFRGRLVLDLYDPVQLEQLARLGPRPTPEQRLALGHVRARLLALLSRADHVLCASARQRGFWLGWLGAAGRLAPATLQADPTAARLLAVVPFGLPEEPPRAADGQGGLRRALGLPPGAAVALFWGGLWDWMDPALAVRAVGALRDRGRPVHLVLLAGARPGQDVMREGAAQARAAASALRLQDRVHLLDRWVPYEERGALLLEADVAVTAHRPSLEAELAFRTRLLDCLWARLPPACTRGDALAAEAEAEGWGTGAAPGDAAGLAGAVEALLEPAARARARAAMDGAAARYRWDRSAAVLLELMAEPPPPRPPALWPGEAAGAPVAALGRALGRKLWRAITAR